MKQKNRVPLFVESLEDRWVPATVRLTGSGLFISNPLIVGGSASITVTATAPNTFTVTDHGQSDGSYNVGGNIYITGSNAGDVITFDLKGQTYGGNLLINGMNGNDSISVVGTAGSTIGGNITILPGFGNDTVGIAATATSSMKIGGSVNVTNTLGADSFTLGNGSASTFVGGDVTVTGDASVNIGAGKTDVIGGSLTVNSGAVNTGTTANLANGLFVGKNFAFNGGSGSDSVIVGSSTIAGNAAINLGSFSSVGDASFGANALVYGNLNVQSGSGSTTFNTVAGATALTVQGNAAFNFGDGNNSFLSGAAAGDINVNGNLNVTEGNGNDTVNLGTVTGTSSNSTVNGSVFVNLGNGTDSTGIAAVVGGTLNYHSGNGLPGDILQVGGVTGATGGNNYNVAVQFGNGDDTFTLATNGLVSGHADGGGRVFLNGTGNVFNQIDGSATATLTPLWTLSNFP